MAAQLVVEQKLTLLKALWIFEFRSSCDTFIIQSERLECIPRAHS